MDSPRSLSFSSDGSSDFELLSNCGSEPEWTINNGEDTPNEQTPPQQITFMNWFGWGAQPTAKTSLPSSPNQSVSVAVGVGDDLPTLTTAALSMKSDRTTQRRRRRIPITKSNLSYATHARAFHSKFRKMKKINNTSVTPSKLDYARKSISFSKLFKRVKRSPRYNISPAKLAYVLKSFYLNSKLLSTYTFKARFKREYDQYRIITPQKLMAIKLFKPKNKVAKIIHVEKTKEHELIATKLFKPKVHAPSGPGKPTAVQQHKLAALKLRQKLTKPPTPSYKAPPINKAFNSVKIRAASMNKMIQKLPKKGLKVITPSELDTVILNRCPSPKRKVNTFKQELTATYLIKARHDQDKQFWSTVLAASLAEAQMDKDVIAPPPIPQRPLRREPSVNISTAPVVTIISPSKLPIPLPPSTPLSKSYLKVPQYHLSFKQLSSHNWLSKRVLSFKENEIIVLKNRLHNMAIMESKLKDLEHENKMLFQQLARANHASLELRLTLDKQQTPRATVDDDHQSSEWDFTTPVQNDQSNSIVIVPVSNNSDKVQIILRTAPWFSSTKLIKNLDKFASHPDDEVKFVYIEAFNSYYQMYDHHNIQMSPIDVSDTSSIQTIRDFLTKSQVAERTGAHLKPIPKEYTFNLCPTINIKRLKQEFCIQNGLIPSFNQISTLFEIAQFDPNGHKAAPNSRLLSQMETTLQVKVIFPSFTNHPIALSSPRQSISHQEIVLPGKVPAPLLPTPAPIIKNDANLVPIDVSFNTQMINHLALQYYNQEISNNGDKQSLVQPVLIPHNFSAELKISTTSTPSDIIKYFSTIYKLEPIIKINQISQGENVPPSSASSDEYRLALLLFSPATNQMVSMGVHKPKISMLSQIHTAQQLQFKRYSPANDATTSTPQQQQQQQQQQQPPRVHVMLSYVSITASDSPKKFQPYPSADLIPYPLPTTTQIRPVSPSSVKKPSYYRLSIQFDRFFPQSAPLRFKLSPTTHTISLAETVMTHILTKFNIADASLLNLDSLKLYLRIPVPPSEQALTENDSTDSSASGYILLETFSSFESAVQIFDELLQKQSPLATDINYSTVLFQLDAKFEPTA